MSVCKKCGLPEELCVCQTLAKEEQKIIIKTVKRRYGKKVTVVDGLNPKEIELKGVLKKLKTSLACGGAVKNNQLELQGDHRRRIKPILVKVGFEEGQIEVRA